jgi:crotonobetainyl-CoA:carnitine CoA-transferase CaiB-like acyl-CoA transferase
VSGVGDERELQALCGLRVLDLSRWVAGEYATKLFADFGADVVKVEKPGEGSLTRRLGPFPGDVPDPEASALFLHLNTNKRSIALDLRDAAERETLLRLVETADALVESFRPGQLERLGLGPEVLHARNPRLVVTRLSAFGQTGPYRDWAATGIVLQAMGGPMHSTGEIDRAPQRKPGYLEHYTIGRSAGAVTLAGLFSARRTGRGAVIDVSGHEVLLAGADRRAATLLAASYSGMNAPRGVRSAHRGKGNFTGPFRALDGYVMLYVINAVHWNRLVEMVSDGDPAFVERYRDRLSRLGADAEEFMAYLKAWFAAHPKQQIMQEGQARRIPVTALLQIDELFDQAHARDRGTYVRGTHPVAGDLDYIGPPWRMAGGYRLRSTAPLLDQHGTQIRAGLEAEATPVPADTPPPATDFPLQRVRVVDLTVVWSGPGATALLGDLGAEVIRVEGNDRTSRQITAKFTKQTIAETGYHANMYPDSDPGTRPYDRCAIFNWHARNKLAACMNLDTPEGHEAVLRLLDVSDVLVENNSNGVLEKLGIGHAELLARNPRLIVARMPPMGMNGPMCNYLGYGPNFNSLVGIAAMDGYEGETPETAGENYHMDEAAPAGLAFAVLAALWDRQRTGRGGLIEFAQADNVMQEIGEFFLDYQFNHRNPPIRGNADPYVLQDVFPTAEEDRWVAIAIRDDRDWRALATQVPGDWVDAGGTAAGRTEHSARLRAGIARWTATQPSEEIVRRLQAIGVPAGEVMTELRVLDDPHLRARGWFQERTHPTVGTHRYPGHHWRAEGFALAFGRPLPGFGEDNEYVYRNLLGYSEAEYAALVERRLVTTEQFA